MVLHERDGHKETLHYGLCMSSLHTDFTDHSSVLVDLLTPVQFLDLNNNHYITRSKTRIIFFFFLSPSADVGSKFFFSSHPKYKTLHNVIKAICL